MLLEAPGMISGSGTAKRTWGSPTVSVAELIKRVEADDPSLTVLDLSNSASFQMKSDDFAAQLSGALKKNTHVRELNLMNCNIGDRGAEFLGEALAENKSVTTLSLEKNRLNQHGASALAKGLAHNKRLESINLMNQSNARWGDSCLDDWIEMFAHNITLLKINWRLESRKSFAINKVLTRNNEIDRRKKNRMAYDDLLPEAVRGSDVAADAKQGKPAVTAYSNHSSEPQQNGSRESTSSSMPGWAQNVARPEAMTNGASSNGIGSSNGASYGNGNGNGSVGSHRFGSQDTKTEDKDKTPSTPTQMPTGSLRDRLKMFEQACQSTPGPTERSTGNTPSAPRRTWGNPTSSVADVIRRVEANDPSLTTVELTNSASFQMRSDEFTTQLCNALARNTHVRELNLTNCGIGDRGGEQLGKALAANRSVTTLILDRNRLGPNGAAAIARGLTSNRALETLNLMDQAGSGTRYGDACLDEFLAMLATNSTLLKIFWRIDSRKSVAINRALTRNSEIDRRRRNNMPYNDLLPDGGPRDGDAGQPPAAPAPAAPAAPAPAPAPAPVVERPAPAAKPPPTAVAADAGADRPDYGPPLWGASLNQHVPAPAPAVTEDAVPLHEAYDEVPPPPAANGYGALEQYTPLAQPAAAAPLEQFVPAAPPPRSPPEALSGFDLLEHYAAAELPLSPEPAHPQEPVRSPQLEQFGLGPPSPAAPAPPPHPVAAANGAAAGRSKWDDDDEEDGM